MFVKHEEREQGESSRESKTLKLSEAIRIGARIRPQCHTVLFHSGGSCAIGAAVEAVTGRNSWPMEASLVNWLRETMGVPFNIAWAAGAKNDAGQTREQIADWLEAQGF